MNRGLLACTFALFGSGCSEGTTWSPVTSTALELRSRAQEKLVSRSPRRGDHLGKSVAMAGNTLVLGKEGAAFIYARTATGWTVETEVAAPNGQQSRSFGRSVAVAGDIAVVGADEAVGVGTDPYGAAFVYRREGGDWEFAQTLVPENGPANSGFGQAVALDGETLVVGGYAAAFVFTLDDGLWGSRQRLPAPVEATSFGQAVAISGNSILVGSPVLDNQIGPAAPAGAAYVFTRAGASFALSAVLSSPNAAAESHFGQSVALSATTALVGADQENGEPAKRGVVYSFVRSGSTFVAEGTLEASDGLAMEQFGASVALLGDMALIGAPYHTHANQNGGHGSAYLFMRSNGTWAEQEELRAFDYQNNDFFGSAVTLSGARALIGSPNDDFPVQAQGSAYLVDLSSEMGEACGAGAQCPSGFCSDGRCCDTACTGACDACSVAAGAVRDGECSLVAEGSPGSPACAPSACSGTSSTCPAGDGTCTTCVADANCAADEYCSAAFVCLRRKAQGRACEATIEGDCHEDGCRVCSSGACVDGFCCDSSCAGECSSCSAMLTGEPDGTCAAVLASADPMHQCEPNAGSGFIQVAAGGGFACGIRTDSRLACWGEDWAPLKPPTGTFTSVTAGSGHVCAIRTGGSVACWGYDYDGQSTPPPTTAIALAANWSTTCATVPDGTTECWGRTGTTPTEPFTSVSIGTYHACALRPDASIACWSLQNGTDTGQAAPPPGQYHSIAAGIFSSCALRVDNTIACWGAVSSWETPPPGTFKTIGLGDFYGCGIRTDNTLACWGNSFGGSIPTGTFKSLSVGSGLSCAIRSDDVVLCWGRPIGDPPPL